MLNKNRIFKGSWFSMDFDIIRYVSIFLKIFRHKLGTSDRQATAVDRSPPAVILYMHRDG